MIQKRRRPSYLDRIPAKELEQLISCRIQTLLGSPQEFAAACTDSALPGNDIGRLLEAAQALVAGWSKLTAEESAELLRQVVRRIVLYGSEAEIEVDIEALADRLLREGSDRGTTDGRESHPGKHLLTLKCSFTLARRRGELRLVLPGSDIGTRKPSSSLLKAIVTAHGWKERIIAGEIYCIDQLATEAKLNPSYAGRILRLAALSPDIVDGVIRDRLVADRSLKHFITGLPLEWNQQEFWLLPSVRLAPGSRQGKSGCLWPNPIFQAPARPLNIGHEQDFTIARDTAPDFRPVAHCNDRSRAIPSRAPRLFLA